GFGRLRDMMAPLDGLLADAATWPWRRSGVFEAYGLDAARSILASCRPRERFWADGNDLRSSWDPGGRDQRRGLGGGLMDFDCQNRLGGGSCRRSSSHR